MSEAPTAHWSADMIVGHALYPEVVAARGKLEETLKKAAAKMGLPPPPLAIKLGSGLDARGFSIGSTGSSVAAAEEAGLPAGALLVRNTAPFVRAQLADEVRPFEVQDWPDPLLPDRTASIVHDAPLESIRSRFGGLVFNAAEVVESRMARWLRRAAVDTLDEVTAAQVVAQLAPHDAAALLRVCPIDAVTSLLRALLQDGLPLGDFDAIAPLLADERRVHWSDPGLVTSAFPDHLVIPAPQPHDDADRRRVIARTIAVPRALRQRAGDGSLQIWTLGEVGGWVPRDGAESADIAYFKTQLVAQASPAASTNDAILLTSPMRRAFVGDKLQPHYPDLMVVGRHELPRGVALQQRGRVHINPPPHPEPAPRSHA